jgi:alpha-ketoglutarate-dependent taurine dioxygenase
MAAQLLIGGALLFRGYEVTTVADFQRFVGAFTGAAARFDYAGGASPRDRVDAGVYTSTEYPPQVGLSLHNELSYADLHPSRLFFCCLVAPELGGETTLGDSRRILRRMDPAVVDTFRTRGVRYVRNLSSVRGGGYSWCEAFGTDDPAEAEAVCARLGAEFEWRNGGVLRVSQTRPATALHPATGEEVWFNQADGFHPSGLPPELYVELMGLAGDEDGLRLNAYHGDGGPIERGALDHVRAVLSEETVAHRWREGDILVLDNFLAAHGRRPFSGPRRIVLAMT